MENVDELLKILLVANKVQEQQQISILLHQMNEMEKNLAEVMRELADVKGKLDEVLDRTENHATASKSESIFSQISEQIADSAAEQKQKLQETRQDLNAKAGNLLSKVKSEGIKALNHISEFLGIQEKLIALRDQTRSSEMKMKDAVERIDAAQAELSGAVDQLKNAGRIIAGNEKTASAEHTDGHDSSKGNAVLRMIKNHCLKSQNKYTRRAEKLDKAIEKFHALEQKASVLGKLSDNKERVAASEEQSPRAEIEHKRDENTR